MPLTLADIRNQAAIRSLFPPTSVGQATERLGLVQIDPMAAPARAQDLILRHRVKGYRAGDMERQYPKLDLAEDLIYVYGYMHASTLALLHPRPQPWRVEKQFPDLPAQVLNYVEQQGEADARTVEAHFGSASIIGNWGSPAKATTKVLEMLHFRGHLRVARRKGTTRIYRAATPAQSDLPPEERLHTLVLLLARLYAPVTISTLKMLVRGLGWTAPTLLGRLSAVTDLIKAGALAAEKVEGVTYVWPAGEWAEGEAPRKVRLLAPFDPVVWDRERFEHLWGWPFRLEAYTPPAKRQFGRYALPILWADQVVGWANLTYKAGALTADLGFAHNRPTSKRFDTELEAELERFKLFLQRPQD